MNDKVPSLKRVHTEERSVSPPPVKRRQQSTTTSKAMADFFKPSSQKPKPTEKISWAIVKDSLLIGKHQAADATSAAEANQPRKIAIFDFDSTLIKTKSGNKFARDSSDWQWWHASVPTTLHRLHSEGYILAILSNQSGINLKSNSSKAPKADLKRLSDFKAKTTAIMAQLDLPISIYAATAKDEFRKPRTGMWRQLLNDHGLAEQPGAVDLDKSMFVGDAAGRSGSATKDFSCSDRDFAANVGIPFRTPEEHFLNEEPRPFLRSFDPKTFLGKVAGAATDAVPLLFTKKNPVDIVILCGSPGAGKSTFYWKHLKPLGYERINQDILKTRDKCLKVAADYLGEGKSVAIDNTNADPNTRTHWVSLAEKHHVPIRCVLFTATAKLCEHNDAVRALNGAALNPEARSMLPKLAFTSFASRYRVPQLKEGFQDITKVDFMFEGSEEERKVWSQYWI
ncbi:polynucleotide kinase 3 phosphatase-domain-containing protein [Macrophomina phaseolina]|uniref:Polynucleotide kinase 3 phosphatase-domain-containing protein n=1 Tax=Macrophomina phaseolina TaxID=35725 RepID=A0ABQ8FYY8_9PEZI|nr:polynucleotide kinase 3 phosphatase-domain-containing protein [Macrophomina phaseolina]